jgi:hypothetical protein
MRGCARQNGKKAQKSLHSENPKNLALPVMAVFIGCETD